MFPELCVSIACVFFIFEVTFDFFNLRHYHIVCMTSNTFL
jgi:hypothetical protein